MKKVLWTEAAAADLHEIVEQVRLDSLNAANKLLDRVDSALRQLGAHPQMGRVVPELAKHNILRYREIVLSPWRLFYRIEEQKIYVLALFDGRRNIEDILLRRLLRGSL